MREPATGRVFAAGPTARAALASTRDTGFAEVLVRPSDAHKLSLLDIRNDGTAAPKRCLTCKGTGRWPWMPCRLRVLCVPRHRSGKGVSDNDRIPIEADGTGVGGWRP